jgi:hypothetical protein
VIEHCRTSTSDHLVFAAPQTAIAHASQVLRAGSVRAVIGLFAVSQRYLNDVRPVAVFFGA